MLGHSTLEAAIRVNQILKALGVFVCAVGVIAFLFVSMLLLAFAPEAQPQSDASPVRPVVPSCKTIPASKWNHLVRTERKIDGSSRRLRKSPVCIHIYKDLKRHVAKVKRANCFGRGVKCWIEKAAKRYGQPLGDALRVADCESDFRPGLVNSTPVGSEHASGLFQFLPSTWATTPYARRNIFSAKWNSLAAMWMWSVGRRGEWACK